MGDVFSKTKRSEIMSLVKGHANKSTELRLVRIFRWHSIRGWRTQKTVFGKPDFVFRAYMVAVFVDGCFWHGCNLHKGMPKTNKAFWKEKLDRNMKRDRVVNRELKRRGWVVIRVWEHELQHPGRFIGRLRKVLEQ